MIIILKNDMLHDEKDFEMQQNYIFMYNCKYLMSITKLSFFLKDAVKLF